MPPASPLAGPSRGSPDRDLLERALLERLRVGPVSGDALAREGGQTRAAVWKRIDALRAAGVEIDATPGRGYGLRHPVELLDPGLIRDRLTPGVAAGLAGLEVAWTIESTNTALLRRATPAAGAQVLFAERQTGGRGRRGREWSSPLAAHLYMSVARQFGGGLARLGGLSLVAGVAVAEVLRELGIGAAQVKWPNDLVVADADGLRKLGGILVEGGGEYAGPVRAVIGLGLNVRMPEACGARITQPWTDLATLGAGVGRNALAAAVLARLLPALDEFDRDGLAPFLPRHAALDALAGADIVVHGHGREETGIACGLADDGALRMRTADGGERRLHAGEVSVRRR